MTKQKNNFMIKGLIAVNNQPDTQFFYIYVYFYSLHVSDSYVSIIRRINCIFWCMSL